MSRACLLFGADGAPIQWDEAPALPPAPSPTHAFAPGELAWLTLPVSGARVQVNVKAQLPGLRYTLEREDTGQVLETEESSLDPRRVAKGGGVL